MEFETHNEVLTTPTFMSPFSETIDYHLLLYESTRHCADAECLVHRSTASQCRQYFLSIGVRTALPTDIDQLLWHLPEVAQTACKAYSATHAHFHRKKGSYPKFLWKRGTFGITRDAARQRLVEVVDGLLPRFGGD